MTKGMHIGMVVPNDVDYGLDLANALSENGDSVTLYLSHARTELYLTKAGTPSALTSEQVKQSLYELKLLPQTCRVRLFRYPRIRDPRSFLVARRIKQTMREDHIDVAHLLMGPGDLWSAVLANLLRDIPVTSTMIIPKPNVGESLPAFVIMAINKLLAFGSNVVIVNGESQAELVQKLYKVPNHRIAYVPLGPRTTAAKWSNQSITEEPGTVLFFGRAHPHKGLEYLAQAQPIITNQVPYARFVIAAHGEDLERCRQMIQDSSKFEIHEGFFSGDEVAAYFERASLITLPYISASTSGILMTAYVFGKPVVASRVGCLPEYVKDGVTGLLVPPSNVEQLAKAIIRLLSDDALRHSMGENARRWVAEEQKQIAMKTVRVYEKTISLHKKR
jgi:glycosyltransferase involved in cell wall biosynthesis